jgi:hypothetical protein
LNKFPPAATNRPSCAPSKKLLPDLALNASIGKTWSLRERLKLQLRGEVFNLIDHPNFSAGSVGGDLTSPDSFGRSGATPDVEGSNPVIGSGGSRHIQLGAKLIW